MPLLPSFATDLLQSYPFWLFDVAPIDQFGLPLFLPIFGFSSITAPELNLEVQTITEGNWFYPRKVITGGSVSPVTLTRGVYFLDAEFWRWIHAGLHGDPQLSNLTQADGVTLGGIPGPTPRRSMVLIHFFSRSPFLDQTANAVAAGVGLAAVGALGVTLGEGAGFNTAFAGGAASAAATASVGGFLAASALSATLAIRIPAKAYLLNGCLPIRYKAASDFDAASSAISIQELEMDVEDFEELSLAA